MKPLSIYLGHITYTTSGSESQTYPLNIGFLKSYAVKRFNTKIDIKLFIYANELCDAIRRNPPDILGLSYYIWNTNISESIFKYAKKINNNILTVVGGPNLPEEEENKLDFWRKRHHFLDIRISGEGEETFSDLLQLFMANQNIKQAGVKIPGLEFYDKSSGTIVSGPPRERIKNIEEVIPSPVLEGYLDQFIHLEPQLQGVRGCPYSCKFCHNGSKYFNKIFHFSFDRIVQEIEYIRKRNKVHNILRLTDDNFGMFDIDLELLEYCQKSYNETGWPIQIRVATAKRISKKFLNAVLQAPDMIRVACHFQSLNDDTIKFVERVGPSDSELEAIYRNFRESKSANFSETALIIPMPNETYETYLAALKKIIDDYKIEHCSVQTLSTFWGCAFESSEILKKFGMKNKYRLEHSCFGEFENFNVCEVDKVCVETNTFSEEEYYEARLFYFFCTIFYFKRNFFYLRHYLTGLGLSIFEWISFLFINRSDAENDVKEFFDKIDRMTRAELFDSPEDIDSFWSILRNREKTISGEFGFNISQMVLGQLSMIYHKLLDFASYHTKEFLQKKNVLFSNEIDELIKLMKKLRLNSLTESEIDSDIDEDFSFDFVQWHADAFTKQLKDYHLNKRLNMKLVFTNTQKTDLKKLVMQYPKDDPVSVSKFYSRVLPRRYFRTLIYSDKNSRDPRSLRS